MVIKHTQYREVLLLSFVCYLAETFLNLLCSLDCVIHIWIWDTRRYHQLRTLINVVSSTESSPLAGYLANESSHMCYV